MTQAGLGLAYMRRVRWEARVQAVAVVTALAEALGNKEKVERRGAAADRLLSEMGINIA